jgi:hypothetical protein
MHSDAHINISVYIFQHPHIYISILSSTTKYALYMFTLFYSHINPIYVYMLIRPYTPYTILKASIPIYLLVYILLLSYIYTCLHIYTPTIRYMFIYTPLYQYMNTYFYALCALYMLSYFYIHTSIYVYILPYIYICFLTSV